MHHNKDKKIDPLFQKNLNNSGVMDITEKKLNKNICEVHFCNAALWCLSRKCIEEVGGFSPTFFHYNEDNNYADRIHYYGKKIGVVPFIKAFHYRENPRSQNKFFTDKFQINYRYMIQELSNPNNKNKHMFAYFYRKLCIKLIFALLTIDIKRIKRNIKLISTLMKNRKKINENKTKSQNNIKLCFLE